MLLKSKLRDLVDDAVQFFQERHFDEFITALLKYKITQDDIDRGKGSVGIATDTVTDGSLSFDYEENTNYIKVPSYVIGVKKIFQFEGSSSISSGMFSIKYQLFLNDVYYWSSMELLSYSMVKSYLEDINFLTSTQKKIRFNKRQDRLYMDIDWNTVKENRAIFSYRLLSNDESCRLCRCME